MPLRLYRSGRGTVLGHTFLMFVHVGRVTGHRHEAVAMVLRFDEQTREAVICSAWGPNTDWMRNLRANPACEVRIGGDTYMPAQRFLSEEEACAVAREFRRRHPWRLRLLRVVLGWENLGDDEALRRFVTARPFVAFRPSSGNG
jgi:deazaflavin-dependent oxidoreductase (nitroreductase family)